MHVLYPHIAHAAPQDLAGVESLVIGLVNKIVPVLFAAAVAFFLWGVAQTMLKSGDAEGLKEGRKKMVFGLIALFVLIGLWGIMSLVLSTFSFSGY